MAVSSKTGASRLTAPGRRTFFSYLKEKLHSLNWGDGCFGDGSGDATGQEVLGEGDSRLTHGAMFLMCLSGNNQYTLDIPTALYG